MKKYFSIILTTALVISCFYNFSFAQSITLDPGNTATSIIDAKSTTKGLLMPRMTEAQRTAISSPTAGLQVYCTNCSGGVGPYTYNGTVWLPMYNTSGITYTIGQSAQGGKIFYVDDSGQHGLVAATADYNSGQDIKWITTNYINTNAVRSGIYGGEYNTICINEIQGNGFSAALAAAQYTGGNYGDWYLPSKQELQLMYTQRVAIGMNSTAVYWSSTEVPAESGLVSETAHYFSFNTGSSSTSSKNNNYKVRAIRRF
jgi:hypothetical protein